MCCFASFSFAVFIPHAHCHLPQKREERKKFLRKDWFRRPFSSVWKLISSITCHQQLGTKKNQKTNGLHLFIDAIASVKPSSWLNFGRDENAEITRNTKNFGGLYFPHSKNLQIRSSYILGGFDEINDITTSKARNTIEKERFGLVCLQGDGELFKEIPERIEFVFRAHKHGFLLSKSHYFAQLWGDGGVYTRFHGVCWKLINPKTIKIFPLKKFFWKIVWIETQTLEYHHHFLFREKQSN